MADHIWRQKTGDGPLVAVALHDGHAMRDEVAGLMALDEAARLREEDPFTGEWTLIAPSRVVGLRSRFEVDLNRPREMAVYRKPEDAWGLEVWKHEPPEDLIERSLTEYDAFFQAMRSMLAEIEKQFGRFVVFDLHSYNHRRTGPNAPPASEAEHPQVNIGTRTIRRRIWAPLVDRFIADLRAFDFIECRLDVRENVNFFGGNFACWVHESFSKSGCVLSVEIKKFFMDEWTGQPDRTLVQGIGEALLSTVPGVLEELKHL